MVIHRSATYAMGTRFEFILEGDDATWLGDIAEEVIEEIQRLDQLWSLFRQDSMISALNRRASKEWVRVDEDTFEILVRCAHLSSLTNGAFDPTIAGRMRALALHGDNSTASTNVNNAPVSMNDVRIDIETRAIKYQTAFVAIDLGGIAKGFALDRGREIIAGHGVATAFLHGGTSTAVAIGSPTAAKAWKVRIAGLPRQVDAHLRDVALSVSSTSSRRTPTDDAAPGHIINPRDGQAVAGDATCAVVLPSATDADAWSTATLIDATQIASNFEAAWLIEDPAGESCTIRQPDNNPSIFHFSDSAPTDRACKTGSIDRPLHTLETEHHDRS